MSVDSSHLWSVFVQLVLWSMCTLWCCRQPLWLRHATRVTVLFCCIWAECVIRHAKWKHLCRRVGANATQVAVFTQLRFRNLLMWVVQKWPYAQLFLFFNLVFQKNNTTCHKTQMALNNVMSRSWHCWTSSKVLVACFCLFAFTRPSLNCYCSCIVCCDLFDTLHYDYMTRK